ncbi:auxin-responsive protein SAUR21-like [Salvia hispanica]|uniref:auxin-responsive protein SAUR21-like n=1 Tax=Salvia hispanica TaxID=49212 RepID=UPI0020091878|nr:auxin-responsive protein SAUR21-like [Salvia hispanica]
MAIRWMSLISNAKQLHKLQALLHRNQTNVPKGHLAVYVGDVQKKRYVVPISYLNHPSFQGLLHRAEEEFGFNHPTGRLTIPCSENAFLELTSRMDCYDARNK